MPTSISAPPRRGKKRWIPKQWRDRIQLYNHLEDFERQKHEAYEEIDKDGFGYWTVITAGCGFLTGAYDIFAVNTVVPLLNIVYWKGNMPPNTQLSISMASLIGTLIGQVVFGILGDRYGRKKMFSNLLVGLIVGTIFLALISNGAQNSLDVLALTIIWRLWMGCFIGGDYPLSAVITAEFAPKKYRGQMVSAVFVGQPLGQMLASIISLIVTSAMKQGITGVGKKQCTNQCLHTADMAWRWIVGFGAVPPVFALILRFYLPESPRWLLEVEQNPLGIDAAAYTVDKFYADPLLDEDVEVGSTDDVPDIDFPVIGESAIVGQHNYHIQQTGHQNALALPHSPSQAPSSTVHDASEKNENAEFDHSPKTKAVTPRDILFKQAATTTRDLDAISPVRQSLEDIYVPKADLPSPDLQPCQSIQAVNRTQTTNSQRTLRQPETESWEDFWRNFRVYLFGEAPWTWKRIWLCVQLRDPNFFDGSWTDLAGLSSTWFLLDFGFYFLVVNSYKLMSKIWDTPEPDDVYLVVFQYSWRIIASTSVGAVVGGAVFIAIARNRWKLQLYGFLVLGGLFIVVGIVFIKLIDGRYFATVIVIYCLCHLGFNLGPNTSTFVIASEVFPTKYRASCHGISAAAGKLGSILTQIFLAEVKINGKGVNDEQSHWLGWALIIQAFVMLVGAFFTRWWVPNPCDIHGQPRSLEELGVGKQKRQAIEQAERDNRT